MTCAVLALSATMTNGTADRVRRTADGGYVMDTGQAPRWGSDVRKWLIVKRQGEWWVFPPNVWTEMRPGSFRAALELVRGGGGVSG